MFSPSAALSAVALGASLSSALLLPPDVAFESTEAQPGLTAIDNSRRLVGIECAECPFAKTEGDDMVWTQDVGNTLLFDLETGTEQDHLSINGVTLFPPTFGAIPESIYVHQIPSDVRPEEFIAARPDHKSLRLTGYEFKFDAGQTISEEGNELLPMQMTIFSLAGQAIPPKTITIHLIKDIEGRLNIANIGLEAASSPQLQCMDFMCKIKAILASKMHGMRRPGCHKMKAHGGMMPPPGHGHHHGDGPHHHRHHEGHHRMHHIVRAFFRGVVRGFFRVLVPILVGIAAGVATYFVGMLLGMTVAFLYLKIRGRNGQYARVTDDEEDVPEYSADEKAVYLDEAPPVYEPAEAEKEVVEKA